MPRAKRVFTPEYRAEAVELALSSEKPVAEVARDLGIGESTLGSWVAKARENGVTPEKPLDVSERAELKRLREELRVAKMERDFLKSGGLLREPAPVRFAFIAAEAAKKALARNQPVHQGTSGFRAAAREK